MKSIPPRSAFAVLALVALLATATPARAEYLIPPGNSAATQYTEAIPTSGGRRDAERDEAKRNREDSRGVLGSRNTRQLNDEGPAGRELAEFTAETAPAGGGGSTGGGDPGSDGRGESRTSGSGGGANPSGSSGFREVVEQATGSSSGELGLLLPLVILAALAWGAWYAVHQRSGPTGQRPSQS